MKIDSQEKIIEVRNLSKHFKGRGGIFSKNILRAVDDVSFFVMRGETLGLVGESGSGKTTIGRMLINLYQPNGGEILFKGCDISSSEGRKIASRGISMVFQDPYSSLDPRMNTLDIIAEPLDIQELYTSREERRERVLSLMEKVGLKAEHASRYPHEFSGGQRQRIGIARAISAMPEFVICDEPVSALDVSVRAQIMNMFSDLKEEYSLSYLFIAHDLPIVRHISDRIAVLYLGKIVEVGDADDVSENPLHPYTKALISSILPPDPKSASKMRVKKTSSDYLNDIATFIGCPFKSRCPYCADICKSEMPKLTKVEGKHFAACHRVKEIN